MTIVTRVILESTPDGTTLRTEGTQHGRPTSAVIGTTGPTANPADRANMRQILAAFLALSITMERRQQINRSMS